MMGFWFVGARDLQPEDEIRVNVMGGVEYLTVREVRQGEKVVRVKLAWGSHVPREDFWEQMPRNKQLMVRR